MRSPIEMDDVVPQEELDGIDGSPPGVQMQMLRKNMEAAKVAPSMVISSLDDQQDALDQMMEVFRR